MQNHLLFGNDGIAHRPVRFLLMLMAALLFVGATALQVERAARAAVPSVPPGNSGATITASIDCDNGTVTSISSKDISYVLFNDRPKIEGGALNQYGSSLKSLTFQVGNATQVTVKSGTTVMTFDLEECDSNSGGGDDGNGGGGEGGDDGNGGGDEGNGGNGHTPVDICHNLGNGSYIEITVDDDGAYGGHSNDSDDIIPMPEGGCPPGDNGGGGDDGGGIEQGQATISLDNPVFTYDGLPHHSTATTDPADLAGMNINYFDSNGAEVSDPTAAGVYQVVAWMNNPNYTASNATGTLTINKAPLKITADNKSKLFSDPDPEFTATYDGFVNGEGPEVLGGLLGFDLSDFIALASNTTNSFNIMPRGLTSDNYAISFFPGMLTVTGSGDEINPPPNVDPKPIIQPKPVPHHKHHPKHHKNAPKHNKKAPKAPKKAPKTAPQTACGKGVLTVKHGDQRAVAGSNFVCVRSGQVVTHSFAGKGVMYSGPAGNLTMP